MKYILTLCFCAVIATTTNLQSQTVKLDTVLANYGDTVLVPLEFYGYLNVGAVTLFIIYDETVLEYIGITNLVPEGQGILTNATMIDTNHVVGIVWSAPGTSGVDFPDGKLMDLEFVFSSGASDLVFLEPNCEIVDWDVNPIISTYMNGRVDQITNIMNAEIQKKDIYYSSNMVFLNLSESTDMEVCVFDMFGRQVYSISGQGLSGVHKIALDQISIGFYILKVTFNSEIITQKIFIGNNH
jgi:hypothetical protein